MYPHSKSRKKSTSERRITTAVRRLLSRKMPHDTGRDYSSRIPNNARKTVAEAIAEAWIKQAINGNTQLLKELLERVEGKVPPAKEEEEKDPFDKIDRLIESIDRSVEQRVTMNESASQSADTVMTCEESFGEADV